MSEHPHDDPRRRERHVHLTGTVRVPATGAEAFRLVTPRGEREWSPGWDPQFMAPNDDDSAPGTVFQVSHGDAAPTTWIVCRRDGDRFVQYARWIPSRNAGLVTVTLVRDGDGSVATVEYELTALTDEGTELLATFASGYEHFLASWETAIAQAWAART